jgi:predicted glycosyltransferase
MENQAESRQILFFSRGLGRGHAIPDAAIAEEILKIQPDLEILFASYGIGAVTLRTLQKTVVDLRLPEVNPLWDTVVSILGALRGRRPALIVSHEEFAAVPIARAYGVPSAFLTDWFGHPDWLNMQCLKYADEVLFLDQPGYYDEPPYLRGKIHYVGSVFRRLEWDEGDRARSRRRLGIPFEAKTILVLPGGAAIHSEESAPLFDLVAGAFEALDSTEKRLLWVVDEPDYGVLATKASERTHISILKPHYDLSATMMASDLVITKGNRTPLLECEVLGIPSISISFGLNQVDDYRASRIRTNTALRGRGLSTSVLVGHMTRALGTSGSLSRKSVEESSRGRTAVAQRLLSILGKGRPEVAP